MTDSGERGTSEAVVREGGGAVQGKSAPGGKRSLPAPAERGRTTIADGVVEKIAALAARDVMGVHALGSGFGRTLGAVRERVPGGRPSVTRGVKAEVGEVQTALDINIVVDYGVAIADVARAVRENVVSAVERMTGLEVVEVNIAVGDVKLPDEEDEEEGEPRIH
ncbi:Asp23/Gls24 family envelope stress response protein [Wenjunlia tyrosinilytica]|uniref:Stress protein n=1 Tax=Wenjunlia tyrosinilytica TaxID=1544741 RepID=A0A918DRK7_9ACTN|nr:Asp23/Gls24 family envelope stress response protein [Wenjunlia tyrosinilytica]GGO81237.1 stress protein [Wenjunlia tyrosinilytica]